MTGQDQEPSIADWLAGKDVLITGATGFMGKVLVEKLLRRCPDVNRLYLVIRPKRGFSPNDRLKDVVNEDLFSKLLEINPRAVDKLVIIPGDCSLPQCGISEEDQQICRDNVAVVFHAAASVRFDEPLNAALKLNTRGTQDLLELAKGMKKLEVFQHISTTFSNCDDPRKSGEKIYPAHLNWKTMVDLVEKEGDVLNVLLPKLIGNHPNTYTMTKLLAENALLEASKDLPIVLVRPSVGELTYWIITPVLVDPVIGWTDNLYGVVGFTAAISKGVLRVLHCKGSASIDYVPVDLAVNGMLLAAWSERFLKKEGEVQVFNQALHAYKPLTFIEEINECRQFIDNNPLENNLWYPTVLVIENKYVYYILAMLLQVLPALLVDLLLIIARKKPRMYKLSVKIYNGSIAMNYFTMNQISIDYSRIKGVIKKICKEDRENYQISILDSHHTTQSFMEVSYQGMKKYFFKEKDEDTERFKRIRHRQKYVHYGTMLLLSCFVLWNTVNWIFDKLYDL